MKTSHSLPYTVTDIPNSSALRVAVRCVTKQEKGYHTITMCTCDAPNAAHIPQALWLAMKGSREGKLTVPFTKE